jgi:hypothetical protein
MLSSVAVRAGELMATMLAAGIVVLAAAVTGVWWLRRRVRRRLGTINHAAAAAHAGWRWLLSQPVPDRRWLAVTRQRRTLWRAVSAAEHAIATAQQAGAPTGDLDTLCRRLRRAAQDADRFLSVAHGAASWGREAGQAQPDIDDLLTAAGLIHDTAASAVASLSQPAAGHLADDVRREAEALAAGLTSAAHAAGLIPARTAR